MIHVAIGSFLACVGISIIFNVNPKRIVWVSINCMIGYVLFVYFKDILGVYTSLILSSFTVGFISEVMARVLKGPATVFLVGALIPLVPGMTAYYTALYASKGLRSLALSTGIDTILQAGSIVVGVSLAATIFKLATNLKSK